MVTNTRSLRSVLQDIHTNLVSKLKKTRKLKRSASSVSQSSTATSSSTTSLRSCNSTLQSLLQLPLLPAPSFPPPCSSSTPLPLRIRPMNWQADLSGVKIYDAGEEEDDWEYVAPDYLGGQQEWEEGAYEIVEVQDLPPHLRGTIV